MAQNEKDMEVEVREKEEYVAPRLVRIGDIARSTENNTTFGGHDGAFGTS